MLKAVLKTLTGAVSLMSLAALSLNLGAAQVKLAWDPNPETDLGGYRVWVTTLATNFVVDAGNRTNATVTNLVAGVPHTFWVTAYNTIGLESDPSESVFYTPPLPAPLPSAPVITSQPTNITVLAGLPAAFKVVATGVPTPSYQWYSTRSPIVGATNPILSFASATNGNAGSYYVSITNLVGRTNSAVAKLTVVTPKVKGSGAIKPASVSPPNPAHMASLALESAGQDGMLIRGQGAPFVMYRLLAADGLSAGWTRLWDIQANDKGVFEVIASDGGAYAQRFFRAVPL